MNEPKIAERNENEIVDIDNAEIQPLSDEDLDSVVGGLCSIWCCSGKVVVAAEQV